MVKSWRKRFNQEPQSFYPGFYTPQIYAREAETSLILRGPKTIHKTQNVHIILMPDVVRYMMGQSYSGNVEGSPTKLSRWSLSSLYRQLQIQTYMDNNASLPQSRPEKVLRGTVMCVSAPRQPLNVTLASTPLYNRCDSLPQNIGEAAVNSRVRLGNEIVKRRMRNKLNQRRKESLGGQGKTG